MQMHHKTRLQSMLNSRFCVSTCVEHKPGKKHPQFQFFWKRDAMQDLWHRIVSEFFPTSSYKPTCEMDIEAYSKGDMSDPDYCSEIWIPVEKR